MLRSLARRAAHRLARLAAARGAVLAVAAIAGVALAVLGHVGPPTDSADEPRMAALPQPVASSSATGACADDALDHQRAGMARRGELDALAALADGGGGGYNDAQAYKWLAVAADFGHARAETMLRSLLEITSLRYDDDGLLVGQMHHELGLAYLSACHGLPHNLPLARQHLEWGREGVMGTEHDFAADRRGLSQAALKVFDEVFPPEALAAPPSPAGAASGGARR